MNDASAVGWFHQTFIIVFVRNEQIRRRSVHLRRRERKWTNYLRKMLKSEKRATGKLGDGWRSTEHAHTQENFALTPSIGNTLVDSNH